MGIGSDDRRFVYYHSRDSTEHHLMKCEEEQEDTLNEFQTAMNGSDPPSHWAEILIHKKCSIKE